MITVIVRIDGTGSSRYDTIGWGSIAREMGKEEVEDLIHAPCPHSRKNPCGGCLICKTKEAWRARK